MPLLSGVITALKIKIATRAESQFFFQKSALIINRQVGLLL